MTGDKIAFGMVENWITNGCKLVNYLENQFNCEKKAEFAMGKKSPKKRANAKKQQNAASNGDMAAHTEQRQKDIGSTEVMASQKLKKQNKTPSKSASKPASSQNDEAIEYPSGAFHRLLHAPIVLESQRRVVHMFLKVGKTEGTLVAHWLEFKYPDAADSSTRSYAPLSDLNLRELFHAAGTVQSIKRIRTDQQQEVKTGENKNDLKYVSAVLAFSSQQEVARTLKLRCRNGVFELLELDSRGYNSKNHECVTCYRQRMCLHNVGIV